MTPWLEDHISAVTDALCSRMNREACGGVYRRFELFYHPGTPHNRGGLAVLSCDDNVGLPGWLPAGCNLHDATSLTRDQVRARIYSVAGRLPILDPEEG